MDEEPSSSTQTGGWAALSLLALVLFSAPAVCQELAPRAYWPGPKGIKVFSIGYSYSDGDILVDPSLPVEGVSNKTHAVTLSYHQFIGLAGRTAGVTVVLPAADADIEASLEGGPLVAPPGVRASGLSDLQLRLGFNLIGAPAMTPQEFQRFRQNPPRRILGASLKVQVPTGEYNDDRVANVGTSRWALKPELGYIHRLGNRGRWTVDVALGTWIYDDNRNFVGGHQEQDPMLGLEAHLIRRISPGRWFSLDWNYYRGGRTTVAGERKDNEQENSRIGGTFNFALKRHVLKVAFSDSLRIEEGGDYRSVLLGYSYAWM